MHGTEPILGVDPHLDVWVQVRGQVGTSSWAVSVTRDVTLVKDR
jgi:hypothetical protein